MLLSVMYIIRLYFVSKWHRTVGDIIYNQIRLEIAENVITTYEQMHSRWNELEKEYLTPNEMLSITKWHKWGLNKLKRS